MCCLRWVGYWPLLPRARGHDQQTTETQRATRYLHAREGTTTSPVPLPPYCWLLPRARGHDYYGIPHSHSYAREDAGRSFRLKSSIMGRI